MALVPKPWTVLVTGLLSILVMLTLSLMARAEPMVATYYGDDYIGALTASGELYDPNGYTAAHPYLPFGTELLVSYNGRSVVVRINDRCACGLDLSLVAAQEIGLIDAGVAVVDAVVLGTEAVPMLPPPADTAATSTEEVPMLPLPTDTAPGVETFQAPDGLPAVEDQSGSAVALEDEVPPRSPVDFAAWPI
jgi:rare lipoprotein A